MLPLELLFNKKEFWWQYKDVQKQLSQGRQGGTQKQAMKKIITIGKVLFAAMAFLSLVLFGQFWSTSVAQASSVVVTSFVPNSAGSGMVIKVSPPGFYKIHLYKMTQEQNSLNWDSYREHAYISENGFEMDFVTPGAAVKAEVVILVDQHADTVLDHKVWPDDISTPVETPTSLPTVVSREFDVTITEIAPNGVSFEIVDTKPMSDSYKYQLYLNGNFASWGFISKDAKFISATLPSEVNSVELIILEPLTEDVVLGMDSFPHPTLTPTNTPVVPTNTAVATNTPVVPTNTAVATNTPVVPTNTAVATNTPVVPTNTAVATNTPVVPTNTAVATNTPVVPTNTAVATNTPIVPTATPVVNPKLHINVDGENVSFVFTKGTSDWVPTQYGWLDSIGGKFEGLNFNFVSGSDSFVGANIIRIWIKDAAFNKLELTSNWDIDLITLDAVTKPQPKVMTIYLPLISSGAAPQPTPQVASEG